jgi:hypothetical protein
VDGEIWAPYYQCSWSADPCGELSCDIATIPPSTWASTPRNIAASSNRKNKSFLIITAHEVFLYSKDYLDSMYVEFYAQGNGDYELFQRESGDKFLITRIDTSARIISGTFQLTLKAMDGSGRTVKLSEGRFDFKYPFCKCSS